MKPDRDATRIVRSWLENGVTQLPDRVLDDVLREIPAIPQRRRSWGAATLPQLNRAAQFGLATAAVLARSRDGPRGACIRPRGRRTDWGADSDTDPNADGAPSGCNTPGGGYVRFR